MIAQAGSAVVEMALLEPPKAQNIEKISSETNEKEEGFNAFGKDGLTFWDVLDIVNPLQHIPIVSTLYRSITGDEIDPAAKIAGGSIYGGPIGALASIIDVAVDFGTGKDIGEHAMALVQQPTSSTTEVADISEPALVNSQTLSQFGRNPLQSEINPYLARAGIETPSKTASSYLASNFAASRPSPSVTSASSGMAGIPISKQSYAEQVAAYTPENQSIKAAAPDLGMLADLKPLREAGLIADKTEDLSSMPRNLAPIFSTHNDQTQINSRIREAENAYMKVSQTANNWLVESMMDGMGKFEQMESSDNGAPSLATPGPLSGGYVQ